MGCPNCDAENLSRSRWRLADLLPLLLLLRRPVRCRECDRRFSAFLLARLSEDRPRPPRGAGGGEPPDVSGYGGMGVSE